MFIFLKIGSSQESEEPNSKAISGHFLLFAGWRNSWFSYRGPAVGARVPSQPVVVVGQMAVWIVSHKPRCAGHLLMETNETKTRMRNESQRGEHREMKMVCNTACKSNRKFKRAKWGVAATEPLPRGTIKLEWNLSRKDEFFSWKLITAQSGQLQSQIFQQKHCSVLSEWLIFKHFIATSWGTFLFKKFVTYKHTFLLIRSELFGMRAILLHDTQPQLCPCIHERFWFFSFVKK